MRWMSLLWVAGCGAQTAAPPVVVAEAIPADAVADDTRELSQPFMALVYDAPLPLRVVKGEANRVTVRCTPELAARIQVEPATPALRITADEAFPAITGCDIELATTELLAVQVEGSGEVVVDASVSGLRGIGAKAAGRIVVEKVESESVKVSQAGSGSVKLAAVDTDAAWLRVSGSGPLTVGEFAADELVVQLDGSADFEVSGKAEDLSVAHYGTGELDLSGVAVTQASVDLTGSGDTRLHVTEVVIGSVSGSGDLDVLGGGRSRIVPTGSGDVRIL